MKTKISILCGLMAMMAASCAKSNFVEEATKMTPQNEISFSQQTLVPVSLCTKSTASASFEVSREDLLKYLQFRNGDKKQVKSVIELCDADGKVVQYMVQYSDGWDLITADKRLEPVLAHTDHGTASLSLSNEGIYQWMQNAAVDLCADNIASDAGVNDIWNLVSQRSSEPVGPIIPIDSTLIIPVYPRVISREMIDSVYCKTSTSWSQSQNNMNYYCPVRNNDSSLKAPAGSLPVAAAQMLYYMHERIGWPMYAPDHAECTAVVGNVTSLNKREWGQSSTIWDDMLNNDNNSAAILVAHMGTLLGSSYGNYSTSSVFDEIETALIPYYQIECEVDSYDAETLSDKMNDSWPMPVIITASPRLNVRNSEMVECFIVDMYREFKENVLFLMSEIEVDPDTGEETLVNPQEVILTHKVTEVQMNWGVGGTDNNVWFSLYDTWAPSFTIYRTPFKIAYKFGRYSFPIHD